MKYKAIIVEDKDTDWIDFLSELLKSINFLDSNIFIAYTQYEALKIISENDIAFSFVDITLPIRSAQSPEVINAGLEIIRQIAENDVNQNFNSLVFLFSNNINDPEVDGYKKIINQYTDLRIIQIPKSNLQSPKSKPHLFHSILQEIDNWQIKRIRLLPKIQQEKLCRSLLTKDLTSTIKIKGQEILVSDFIIPEMEYNGIKHLDTWKILLELEDLTQNKNVGIWKNKDLLLKYTEIINNTKDLEFINDKVNLWYSEIMLILKPNAEKSMGYETVCKSNWLANTNPFAKRKSNAETLNVIKKLIIWRRILIRLDNMIDADLLTFIHHNGKNETGHKINCSASENTSKFITTHLGFRLNGVYIKFDNLFQEEEFYKSKL
jgi:hypothetical protein